VRIAIVGPFFLPQCEGIEKAMLFHARHLVARGHEVHVVTSRLQFPRGEFSDAPAREEMDGFTIHRLDVLVAHPGWRFFYVNNSGLVIRGLIAAFRRISPDVLHVHQIGSPAWAFGAAWYAWTRRRRLFYTPHWHPDAKLDRWFYNSILHGLNWLPMRVARRVYMLTKLDFEPFRREYPKIPPEKLKVFPPGVQPALQLPRPQRGPGELSILFVGRVEDRRKGFDVLRAAFARSRQPGWTLNVIGRIADDTRASLLAEFGGAVRILGMVPEAVLEAEYAACDVFCMPSRYEGFGLTFIEAMRYGCVVVGTTAGGVPEVVPPGTGLLVPPEDIGALADVFARLGADPAERQLLGEGGKAWAAKFDWAEIVAELEREYLTA
jgi:glycosyltransferase involved in cell wall biosynthesis